MSNLANVDVLEGICPQCGGDMVLLIQEYVCSQCGLRLLPWFDPGRSLQERAKDFHMKLKKIIEECPPVSNHDVLEAEEADISPGQLLAATLPRLSAPFMLTTYHELRKLMKRNCLQDEAPRRQRLTHGRPTSAPSFSSFSSAGCSSEAQQKPCTSVVPDLICDIDIDDPAMDEFGSPRCPDPIKRDCDNCEIAKARSKLWSRGP